MSDHRCDSGNFDRTICPAPCGRMHSYCDTCGERQDGCAHEPMPNPTPTLTDELHRFEQELSRISMTAEQWRTFRAAVTRMVADAEQRGRELGSRAEAALWRQQIEDRDRSGIMALDRQLAEEEGYERGRAEVSAAVEAVWPDPFGEFTAAEAAAAKLMKDAIRAALTDPAAAVARIKAEALREAAEAYPWRDAGGVTDAPGGAKHWLRDRADRIGGDA